MSDAQTKARTIETRAWNCDEWPEWLHKIVDETNEVADRLDMSSEQAHAYAVLTALAAKDAELAALQTSWRKLDDTANEWADRAHCAEAQLAEARKALDALTGPEADMRDYHEVASALKAAMEAGG